VKHLKRFNEGYDENFQNLVPEVKDIINNAADEGLEIRISTDAQEQKNGLTIPFYHLIIDNRINMNPTDFYQLIKNIHERLDYGGYIETINLYAMGANDDYYNKEGIGTIYGQSSSKDYPNTQIHFEDFDSYPMYHAKACSMYLKYNTINHALKQ